MEQYKKVGASLTIFFTFALFAQPFIQELKKINALTVRKIDSLPRGYRISSISELVHAIYTYNSVPYRSIITAHTHYFMVHRGITIVPQDDIVFIFSRGYAKTTKPGTNDNFIQCGAGAKAAHIQFDDQIIPAEYPLVSFDFDDSRIGFSFGQEGEINTLKTVYNAILYCNPNAHIVLVGDCRGAKVTLEFATQRPKNIIAMILMTPFISGKELTDNIARSNLSFPLSRTILHNFFRIYFKNYHPKQDTLFQRLRMIDPQIPIFIGYRRNDQLVSMSTINQLTKCLKQTGNKNVQVVISNDTQETHSKLTKIPEIQQGIARFIDQYVIYRHIEN